MLLSITPRKTVLVTGINGYLASVVAQHFLEHGYNVRGTVRSLSKTAAISAALNPLYASSLSFVEILDMTNADLYDKSKALEGVDVVCHVASPQATFSDRRADAHLLTMDVLWWILQCKVRSRY